MEKILNDYNCAQKTFSSVSELVDLEEEQIYRVASAFGGGMQMGEVCGCVTGALMAIGLKYGSDDPTDEVARNLVSQHAEAYVKAFREKFGTILCRELLGIEEYSAEAKAEARKAGKIEQVCPVLIAFGKEKLAELMND